LGALDHELWKLARVEARTIVTTNARDFLRPARKQRSASGLRRHSQRWLSGSSAPIHHDRGIVGDRGEIVLTEIVIREKGNDPGRTS
jgi:hypothetical protein